MPWCERCDRFLNPNTVNVDGTCPTCGRLVDPGRAHQAPDSHAHETLPPDSLAHRDQAHDDQGLEGSADEDYRAPWHFWVMVVAVVAYLGWRLVEAIIWGWDRLF